MDQALKPIIIDAPQRSEIWYSARLGNVTSSMVKATLEYNKPTAKHYKDATEVYMAQSLDEEITSEMWSEYLDEMYLKYPHAYCLNVGVDLPEAATRKSYRETIVAERITRQRVDGDQYITEEMKWGIINEGVALNMYQLQYKMHTKTAPLFLHPELLTGSSPDALVEDIYQEDADQMLGNAEVKCLKTKNHLYKIIMRNQVPDEYMDQIQHQMLLTGRRWCDFIAYDSRPPDGLRIYVRRVRYDEFYVKNVMMPGLIQFLCECDRDERIFGAIMRKNLQIMQDRKDDRMLVVEMSEVNI